ncbi:MAG: site-2 protease family protein [Candidatus Micrarchaeota archaeon]|nr:site-2 protease family protein [Candidatus Micrarchaeota archaeon]
MLDIEKREIEEIAICMLAISIALFIASNGIASIVSYPPIEIGKQLGVLMLTVGTGFICHEMAHKFVAQRYGARAGFVMWPTGLLIMFVFAVLFGFVFAAPGAVYIYARNITREQNGKISVAGPLTNIVLAGLFFAMLPFAVALFGTKSILTEIAFFGYLFNTIFAGFNLLPIFPLDGSKVLAWNWIVWLGLLITAAMLYFVPMMLLA